MAKKYIKNIETVQAGFANGSIKCYDGMLFLHIKKDDFPKEFQKAIKDQIKREAELERLDKKARFKGNVEQELLKSLKTFDTFGKKLVRLDLSNVEKKTLNDYKDQLKNKMLVLCKKFEIEL